MSETSENIEGLLKYWSETQNKVILGAERARKPVSLRSLLGSYRWVYNGGQEVDDQQREIDETEWGVLTLLKGPAKNTTPDNIFGKIRMLMIKGTFEGLEVADTADEEDDYFQTAGNIWDIKELEWEDGGDEYGNGIAATQELDDSGHPFLMFYHAHEERGHCVKKGQPGAIVLECNDLYLLKKQKKNGPIEFLSEAEKGRLGFYLGESDSDEEESGSEIVPDEEDELDSDAEDELDSEDEEDPYDKEEALKLSMALKEEETAAKLEDEDKAIVFEKRSASEDLSHDSKRQRIDLASEKE